MTRRDRQAQERYLATEAGKLEKKFHEYVLGKMKKNDENENKEEGEVKESSGEPASCRG